MNDARGKVLILMTSPLDMIAHALRAVSSFKEQVPGLRFTWVARRVYEPLVAAFSCVDRTIVFHRQPDLRSMAGLYRALRGERFDYVLDLEGHARTGLMCWLAKAPRKIGRQDAREGATAFYRELAPPSRRSGHALDAMIEFGRVFGLESELRGGVALKTEPPLPPCWLEEGAAGRLRLCLFPSRFKKARAWPGMLDLARRLVENRPEVAVFLLGEPDGSGAANSRGIHDLRGTADWPRVCGMVAQSELVVANDNGPAQLASAFGRPNLSLYTWVDRERRGSYPLADPRHSALRAPGGEAAQFDPDLVYREVEKLLGL